MDHVATEPLSRMTFRSLANALGVSTYSFVYHFGSRQETIDAILEEGVRQQTETHAGIDVAAFDREQFRDWFKESFRHSLRETNRTSMRLQFEAGVLERRQYSDSPVRHDYHLTRAGRDLAPVLSSLLAWGDRWAVDAPPVTLRHHGHRLRTRTVCATCGEPVHERDVHREFHDAGWAQSGPVAIG